MKKISSFIALAIAATILSGCYVAPYSPYSGGQYRQRGSQCPPPIKVDLNITKMKKKKFDCEREPDKSSRADRHVNRYTNRSARTDLTGIE